MPSSKLGRIASAGFVLALGCGGDHHGRSTLSSGIAAEQDWPMYGLDISQTRFNSHDTAIDAANVAGLHRVWSFPTAGAVTATPAVVGNVVIGGAVHTVLYVGAWDHNFYALDADDGHRLWEVTVATPQGDTAGAPFPGPFPGIQSSVLVEDGKVYFGDSCGYLHAYAADGSGAEPTTMTMRARGCGSTGTEISGFPVDVGATLKSSDDAAHTDIFSSPIPHTPTTGPNKGRHMIYVGASSHVDNPCIHGAELAIDASTGVPVWRFDTVPESAIGAGVWSSAAIDAASDLVYIDTGDCVATASAGFAESIVALDASCSGVSLDGSCPDLPSVVYPAAGDTNAVLAKDNPVWAFAAHPNGEEADLDFGSSPNLFVTPAGESLVGAGSKDGSYYAVTAGRAGGRLAWTTRIVDQQTPATTISIGNSIGTPSGGFIGSTGAAYGKIFGTTISGPEFLVALAAGSGALAWDGIDALTSFASVAVANKIVFSADTLGFLRAHDADDGTPLAVANAGGPITSGPVVAHGKVFVGTGFGTVNLGGSGVFAFAP